LGNEIGLRVVGFADIVIPRVRFAYPGYGLRVVDAG